MDRILWLNTDITRQSFSSLLSSIGEKSTTPGSIQPNGARPSPPVRQSTGDANRFKLTANNAAAGVKRRSEEPEAAPRQKLAKVEQSGQATRPVAAPGSRFQLTSKTAPARTSSPAKPTALSAGPSSTGRPRPPNSPNGGQTASTTPQSTTDTSARPKKGFASILEKAKAAQAAASTANVGGIKHKPVEKLTRKERQRLREEALAAQKGKKLLPGDRSRSGTPNTNGPAVRKPGGAVSTTYQGTMKKATTTAAVERAPLSYRGTMKSHDPSLPRKPAPKKGAAQDKYGGYASWSDLSDAEEDEEEDGYGYDESDDDMEGGFDDLEAEENAALRAAKKEDQEALEEEERLKREKAERRRKLMALSRQAAAGRKKF